jgi:hypothetical protein
MFFAEKKTIKMVFEFVLCLFLLNAFKDLFRQMLKSRKKAKGAVIGFL